MSDEQADVATVATLPKQRVTLKSLAAKHGISVRTMQNDIAFGQALEALYPPGVERERILDGKGPSMKAVVAAYHAKIGKQKRVRVPDEATIAAHRERVRQLVGVLVVDLEAMDVAGIPDADLPAFIRDLARVLNHFNP